MEEETETWDGPKLAHDADPDELDFDKINVDIDADDEEDDDEDDSEEFDVQLSPSDERLLEELLRLKLTSLPSSGSSGENSSLLPLTGLDARGPLQRLLEPRSKLEQFEDIIFESQLLEAGFPELEAAAAAVASNGTFESVGFDFDASDAIFNDEDVEDNEDNCDCSTCKERMRHKEELQRLKETWSEVRSSVIHVYQSMMSDEADKPDVSCLKEKVRQLLWRDPHQLFQRLESIVKDCVLEQKVRLIKLLKSQAKNPSLAQDFIQRLLDGYEKLCNASLHLRPVLDELENEHLSRFSMTWEVLNKYLHQSIIYSDPIIQTNVPIFISQLRSLYSDKEHEGKYTELVRGFLDFDVEMSNIVPLWTNSEKLLNEYDKQQAQLRAKQKMLKEDWERFKAQRRDLKIQMDKDHKECTSSSSLVEGLKNEAVAELGESLNHILTRLEDLGVDGLPADLEIDLRHVMNLESPSITSRLIDLDDDDLEDDILEPFSFSPEDCNQMAQLLSRSPDSRFFPMDEDFKPAATAAEPFMLLPDQLSLNKEGLEEMTDEQPAKCPNFGYSNCDCDVCKNSVLDNNQCKSAINGNGIAPSSSASKLAQVFPSLLTAEGKKPEQPQQPSTIIEADAEKIIEDEEMTAVAETKPPPPASSKNGVKKPPPPASAPPPKKATTAKELRDLMYQHYCVGKGKLKKPSANAIKKGKVPPPTCSTVQATESKTDQDSTDQNSSDEDEDHSDDDTCSETSKATTTTASESHNKNGAHCNCCYCEVFGPGGQTVAPVSRNYPEMRERLRLLLSKKKRKSQQPPPPPPPKKSSEQRASSASSSTSSNMRSSRSERSKESPAPTTMTSNDQEASKAKEAPALDELLDFIEGNQKSTNEKKKAKKERQKQQKLAEIRKREEEIRKKREAEEAERKRLEAEAKKAAELQKQMDKKRKKKEAQRLKKLAAKGELPPDSKTPPTETEVNPELALEELRAKHMRELQELQIQHQRQLEEEAKRLKMKQPQPLSHAANEVPVNRMDALNAKPGTQIKITRTPAGGVEFTTVPASGAAPDPVSHVPMRSSQPDPSPRPSVPSKTGAPMVTIRRIETPGAADPMVTISMAKDGKKVKDDKLLYTLVNGQAMRTNDAPSDLLPNAKLMDNLSKKQKKKLKKQNQQENSSPLTGGVNFVQQAPPPMPTANASMFPSMFQSSMGAPFVSSKAAPQYPAPPMHQQKPRPPLPLDSNGKVDLDRLHLPQGITITRLNGPAPERKYFPASASEYGASRDQSVLPLPGTLAQQEQSSAGVGYSTMEGMPSSLNGPNVIVVDTSSLKTREEEEKEKKGKKKKKNKNKSEDLDPLHKSASVGVMPSYMTSMPTAAPSLPSVAPSSQGDSSNSLKSGPQVLIKNVNGKVTITPVPGTGATPIAEEPKKKAAVGPTPQVNGRKQAPQLRQVMDVQKSQSVPNINGHVHQADLAGQNGGDRKFSFNSVDGDDPDKVFAPSNDIDMDKADDSDRVVEQYKRFLAGFPSPQDQPRVRPKVELDLKNIFKKKPAGNFCNSNGNLNNEPTS